MADNIFIFIAKYFAQGLSVGFLASIPLGPIGVLCIQRTLNKGRLSGFVSGAGAATSDFMYAIVAAFSVSMITDFIDQYKPILAIIFTVVLMCLGLKMLLSKPHKIKRQRERSQISLWQDYVSMFFLTVSNPLVLVVFLAAFSFMSTTDNLGAQIAVVCGVLMGALSWWLCLTMMVGLFRKKFTLRRLLYLNRIAGVAIIILVLVAIVLEFSSFVSI